MAFTRDRRYWCENLLEYRYEVDLFSPLQYSQVSYTLSRFISLAHQNHKYVPHDTAMLITLQGGTQRFIDRLDFIIDNVSSHPRCDENPMTETGFLFFSTFRDTLTLRMSQGNKYCLCTTTQIGLVRV